MTTKKTAHQPDEPDIRIPKKEPYRAPDLRIEWEEHDDGSVTMRLSGEMTETVTPTGGKDGLAYESPAYKGGRTMRDAIRHTIMAGVNDALAAEWSRKNPTKRSSEKMLAFENQELRRKIDEMMALLNQSGEATKETRPKAS